MAGLSFTCLKPAKCPQFREKGKTADLSSQKNNAINKLAISAQENMEFTKRYD